MVQRASTDRTLITRALRHVPDLPEWIDTRGMLLSGRAVVAGPAELSTGFIVVVADAALASVVGRPAADDIRSTVRTLAGDVNVLAQMDAAQAVSAALPSWTRRAAILHALPYAASWEREREPNVRVFTRENAPRFDHVPEGLRRELTDALAGRPTSRFVHGDVPRASGMVTTIRVPMAAAWAEGRPVSFCYPVWQTETLWDVAIDTLEPYRRRGLGERAARTLVGHMRGSGRAPVWGAIDTNTASRTLAARLGFIEVAGIAVFSPA